MSSPPSSIPPFSLRLPSRPCAHHMRSCVAMSGSQFRRRPIASLSSTFSNYPCPSMAGQQRRRVKTSPLASARVDPFVQIAESPRLSSQVVSSLENITQFLTHRFPTSSGKFFTNVCHPVRNGQNEETCFTSTFSEIPKSETLTLAFAAGGREDFISALTGKGTFLSDASRTPYKKQPDR